MGDDRELLRRYLASGDQEAFAELVRRHVDLVYGTCRRSTGDAHLAEDLTQAVFLLLASRGARIGDGIVLAGWLHRTACYVSANARRGEAARRRHEAMAGQARVAVQEAETVVPDEGLDKALGRLKGTERDAVLLRFFQGMSAREVGEETGVSEEAAKKRVARGLERLRELLGGAMSVGAVGAVLTQARAASAAPAGLAEASVCAAAQGLASTGPAAVLAKGALAMMAFTRIGIVAACVGVALVAGIGVIAVRGQPPEGRQQLAEGRPAGEAVSAPAARGPEPVLARPLPEVRFERLAFGDALDFFRDISGMKVDVDWGALQEADIQRKQEVSLRVGNLPFGQMLHALLWEVAGPGTLDYVLEKDTLKISTAKALNLPPADEKEREAEEAKGRKVLEGLLVRGELPEDQRGKPIKVGMTLPEAAAFLRDVSSVNIWLNREALQEHMKVGETRVNAELSPSASLEASLKMFLAGIDTRAELDFAYVNGLVVISTKEDVRRIKEIKPAKHVR